MDIGKWIRRDSGGYRAVDIGHWIQLAYTEKGIEGSGYSLGDTVNTLAVNERLTIKFEYVSNSFHVPNKVKYIFKALCLYYKDNVLS